MTLLERLYVNLDQRNTWPSINVDGDRRLFMQPLLNCFATLGKASTRSIEIIVSDRYLSSKYGGLVSLDAATQAQWAEIRWTVGEKRKWVKKMKLAIQIR